MNKAVKTAKIAKSAIKAADPIDNFFDYVAIAQPNYNHIYYNNDIYKNNYLNGVTLLDDNSRIKFDK